MLSRGSLRSLQVEPTLAERLVPRARVHIVLDQYDVDLEVEGALSCPAARARRARRGDRGRRRGVVEHRGCRPATGPLRRDSGPGLARPRGKGGPGPGPRSGGHAACAQVPCPSSAAMRSGYSPSRAHRPNVALALHVPTATNPQVSGLGFPMERVTQVLSLTQRPNIVPATDRSGVGSVRGVGDTRWTAVRRRWGRVPRALSAW